MFCNVHSYAEVAVSIASKEQQSITSQKAIILMLTAVRIYNVTRVYQSVFQCPPSFGCTP